MGQSKIGTCLDQTLLHHLIVFGCGFRPRFWGCQGHLASAFGSSISLVFLTIQKVHGTSLRSVF